MVERDLAKVEVASSNLVSRSIFQKSFIGFFFIYFLQKIIYLDLCKEKCVKIIIHDKLSYVFK